MDTLSLIVSALSAGALAGAQELAGEALKDAYQALRGLVQKKLESKPQAKKILKEHAKDPVTWEKPLAKVLKEARVAEDTEIVGAAERLLMTARIDQSAPSRYAVQVSGEVQGMVTGDRARVTMHFAGKNGGQKR